MEDLPFQFGDLLAPQFGVLRAPVHVILRVQNPTICLSTFSSRRRSVADDFRPDRDQFLPSQCDSGR